LKQQANKRVESFYVNPSVSDTQSSIDTKDLQDTIPSTPGFNGAVGQILINAYSNTVYSQKNLNTIAAAVFIKRINTLYAIVIVALGEAEVRKIKNIYNSFKSGSLTQKTS
jgi:hypothetical protein